MTKFDNRDNSELEFLKWLDDCIKTARSRGLEEDEIIERLSYKLYQLCLAKTVNRIMGLK